MVRSSSFRGPHRAACAPRAPRAPRAQKAPRREKGKEDGTNGTNGPQGEKGKDCTNGINGLQGARGDTGVWGLVMPAGTVTGTVTVTPASAHLFNTLDSVPTSELVLGSVWELYAAGEITPSVTDAMFMIGINFSSKTPGVSLGGAACLAAYANHANTQKATYDYNGTFRVLGYDNISLTVAGVGKLVVRRPNQTDASVLETETSLNTEDRTATPTFVGEKTSVILCASANYGDFCITCRLAYIRRIA
jgi:hypothetical protein